MKLVKCIIQPQKLDEVVRALTNIVPGMTVSDVRGHGRQKGRPVVYRGAEYDNTLLSKVVIDIVADDNRVDDVVALVIEKAKTGQIGDGRIFILPLEANYHIRTGFMDLG